MIFDYMYREFCEKKFVKKAVVAVISEIRCIGIYLFKGNIQ